MSATGPLATVVIPTHNRVESLLLALAAFERQDCDPDAFEIVVVPNGCTDDTVARLRGLHLPFRVRVVEIDAPSASLARNAGVEHARAPLMIFLDDDIVPAPSFVGAHLAAHRVEPGTPPMASARVVIGYLPARLQEPGDRFAITLRAWWEAMFDRMREPGHRFAYTDLLSGNFSIPRVHFLEAGGFDSSLRCHEDYELGYRLISGGAQLVFAEDACGTHADVTRLAGACERKRQEGRADVQLAQRHPHLRSVLPMSRPRTPRQRLSRVLAFQLPTAGDLGARMLTALLPALDRMGATSTWLRTLYGVFGYWYERGLADAVGTRTALADLLAGAQQDAPPDAADVDVDLAGGLRSALHEVDRLRPLGVMLHVGDRPIGRVPWQPGAERLAGRHVAAALVRQYHRVAFDALRAAGHVRLTAPGPHPAYDMRTGGEDKAADEAAPALPPRLRSSLIR